jgi:hypothetical protein
MGSLKIKRMSLQFAFLRAELEEVEDICTNVEKDIRSYLKDKYPEHFDSFFGVPEIPTPNTCNETEEPKKAIVKNKDLKKIYRRIAEKTHPDKVGNSDFADVFSSAAKAYEENNLGHLLEIAGTLNIELVELHPESYALIENNIKTISSKINSKKNTAAWSWNKAENDEDKEKLMVLILKNKGIEI